MVKEIEECGIDTVSLNYGLKILSSLLSVRKRYKLNDLELRILLSLYGLSTTQYKLHISMYGVKQSFPYTVMMFKQLFDQGFIEVVGYSVRAALFGLTDKGVEVVNAVFDGVEGDL